jgi:hypothetical protein
MQGRIAILAATVISLALIGVSVAIALESGLFSAPRAETVGTLAPVLTPDPGSGSSGGPTEPPSATSTPTAVHDADQSEEEDVGEANDPPHQEGQTDDD